MKDDELRFCKRCGGYHRLICPDVAGAHAFSRDKPDYLSAVREYYANLPRVSDQVTGEL